MKKIPYRINLSEDEIPKCNAEGENAGLYENGSSCDYRQRARLHPDRDRPDHRRSEERRVGKECRYRWSPYH